MATFTAPAWVGQGRQGLASVQVGLRPNAGRHVHPVQLRYLHQDGFLADAQAPGVQAFEIQFDEDSDIDEIVEFIRPLRIAQIIPNSVVIAGLLWEASTCNTRRSDYLTTPGATPDNILKQIQKDKHLGAWNVVLRPVRQRRSRWT